jgi:hypothetical protein
MKCPPSLLAMRIRKGKWFRFRIWFPLFLFWPLMLVGAVLGLIGSLIVDACCRARSKRGGYTRLLVGVMAVFAETRGTKVYVDVDRADEKRSILAFAIY